MNSIALPQQKKSPRIPVIEHPTAILERQIALIRKRTEKPELPTGIDPLDEVIMGFQRKCLTIIAGRPGEGKTALATQCAMNLGLAGKKVIYVSLEMPKGDILERMMVNHCDLDSTHLRRGIIQDDFEPKIAGFREFLNSSKLRITEGFGYKSADIEQLLQDCGDQKPDVMVIDHVNKISGEGFPQRRDAISHYTLEMERLAMQNNIAMILLSQLNRKATETGRPSMEHLKESGTLEEAAATILFLRWRTLDKERKNPAQDTAFEIIVGKQRYGDSGMTVEVEFHAHQSRFGFHKQEVWMPMVDLNGNQARDITESKTTQEEVPF